MSLPREVRPVIRSVVLFTLLVLACRSDSTTGPGANPQVLSSPNLAALVCTANPSARTLSCASPVDPGNRGTSLNYAIDPNAQNPSYAIFGGNHTNVEVTTTNIVNDTQNHHFSFDLTLKNLSVQPIGTTNGISSDGSLSIFFQSGPTATGGTGIVTVSNPDGFGTFTGAGQPFFSYGEMLAQNQTSNSKNWVIDYAPAVTSFSFILLINASLQFPDGYIDIYPKAGAVVTPGTTLQLADTVRNGLGAVNSLQKVEWSSSDPTTVTVDTLGLVKGIKLGSATITATQSLKIGTAIVQVLPPTPPNAANDTTASNSAPGAPFHAFFNTEYDRSAPGVLANDDRGAPLALVASFGSDSLGGLVTDHAAGSAVSPLPGHADGSLQINANGSVSFTPPTGFTGYYQTSYRMSNGVGTSDATLRLAVGQRPAAFFIEYGPHLLGNVGINTAFSTQTKVGATGDGLTYVVMPDTSGLAIIHSDGTFEYKPNAGRLGPVVFGFQASNGFGDVMAKVRLTIDGPRIWFVDVAAAPGGNGRYGSPFNCIAGANCYSSVSAQGDVIHIRHGTYLNTTTWNLQINSRVIGEGAPGLFSDASNANVEWPADAGPQPSTGGARPIINSGNQSVLGPADNTLTRGVVLGSAPVFSLSSQAGNFTLTDAAIVNGIGGAVSLQNFGAANISVDSIISGSSPGGAAMSISNRTGTLNSAVTKIIGTEGINISKGSISINLGSGVLQSTNAAAVNISQSQANFSFAGAVSNSFMPLLMNGINVLCGNVTFSGAVSSTQRGIDVRNCTGGSVSFSGAVTLSTAANPAISVLNSAAPVTFSGGALSATTTTANALFARKAEVSVSGANNSLTSAGAPALVLDTVSTSGLNFRSISATGGTTGIFVRNTSGTGGLTVTGSAGGLCSGFYSGSGTAFSPPIIADCTGGTIQGMTGTFPDGVGVYLENTRSISLSKMRIRGNVNFGISGDSVAGFAMGRDYVSNNGLSTTGQGTGNIYLRGLIGTGSIDASFVDSGAVANVLVEDTVGTLDFIVHASVIGNDQATTGRRGVFIHALNSTINASIQNNRFLGSRQIGAHMLVNANSAANFTFTGNVMTNNHPLVSSGHNAVVVEGSGTAGSSQPVVTYNIASNTINNNTSANLSGDAIFVFKGSADNGHFRGTISGNSIGNGVSKSGSALGSGIAVTMIDRGADTVNILNNTIKNTAIDGITLSNQAPTSAGSLVATITGNNINTPELTSLNPISFFLGQPSSAGKNCLTIGGAGVLANTVNYSSIFLTVRTSTPVGLPGLAGDPAAYIAARNNGAPSSINLFPPASLSGTCP